MLKEESSKLSIEFDNGIYRVVKEFTPVEPDEKLFILTKEMSKVDFIEELDIQYFLKDK